MSSFNPMIHQQKFTGIYLKYVTVIIVTFALLLGMRWAWSQMFPISEDYHPVNGVLDLRHVNLGEDPALYLNGEWDFYPGELLTLSDIQSQAYTPSAMKVPGDWGNIMNLDKERSYGYGTYHLRILMGPLDQPVAFWFRELQAAAEVEINGETTGIMGKVATTAEEYIPHKLSFSPSYSMKKDSTNTVELVIRMANFDSPGKGGIAAPVRFGSQAAIDYVRWYSIGLQIFIFLVLALHGLYALILYFISAGERSLIYTFMLTLCTGIAILIGHDNILLLWLPIDYSWAYKLRVILLLWQNVFILLLFSRFTSRPTSTVALRIFITVCAVVTAVLLVTPVSFSYGIVQYYIFDALFYIAFIWLVMITWNMLSKQHMDRDIVFLIISICGMVSNLIWSGEESARNISTVYYPVDLIVAITGFSTYWFNKYFRHARANARLNEQLQIADQLKDQFLANTSHELKTPLHGIMNIAHNLAEQEKHRLSTNSMKDMKLLITITRRMSQLIDDLLDVVRLKEQRIVLERQPLKVQSIVTGVAAMLNFITERKPIELQIQIPDALPSVMADEKRLVQIVHNLLHNALKYTEKGTIIVSAELQAGQHGDQILVSVRDTGIGMNEELQRRIFLPYEQGGSGSEGEQGMGLGLSICKQLIELHGGTLYVESEPDKGSVFTFNLPVATTSDMTSDNAALSEHVEAEAAYRQEELAAAGLTDTDVPLFADAASQQGILDGKVQPLLPAGHTLILAVDDNPINLKVLESMLSSEPYSITAVASAREALEILDTRPWDLLIADVMMPQMSGYELTQQIRERYSMSELPVLLLTARTQPSDIYAGFSSGANDYVTKPVDAMELKYRIRALISLKQSINERLRLEAAYLQAQIQPHFLFNAFNSVMALSYIDTDRMRKLGDVFASFLRISFNYLNTGELVELSHELELIKSYLYIEKERFGERLSVVWNVGQAIELMLPPLSIQPLVENAVRHGLLSRSAGGTLTLTIARVQGGIKVEVQDNGKGMTEEQVQQLLTASMHEKNGIGIANTNRRLIHLYGQGLSILSEPDVGTTVSFVIPQGARD
ncbi:hybrid sensor histidine kinase/response regulator [Paenibacillus sp. FSL K6-1230]|uniref:hybrid sensor histidine kinase/response regulator n=1 Tax=Paenibacillus sp. FSL K6-1230 TaxID=2921603 RepID=UPI0030F4F102